MNYFEEIRLKLEELEEYNTLIDNVFSIKDINDLLHSI